MRTPAGWRPGPPMDVSLLNNPVWHSLAGAHEAFGVHHDLARRYRREVTQIAAIREPGFAGLEALATLTEPGESLYLAQETRDPLPGCWALEGEVVMWQMVLGRPADVPPPAIDAVVLGSADVPEMCALAALTHPGPFGPEGIRLGRFLGVRRGGHLVAMAGQRFRVPGFVEISGVCTHPEWQGHGFARALMNRLAAEIQGQGDTPFLHVLEANTRAAALYGRMGFVTRICPWARIVRRVA
ncbi:MAG: GNAT family N-acetyltransferase [Opitutales bacterium]